MHSIYSIYEILLVIIAFIVLFVYFKITPKSIDCDTEKKHTIIKSTPNGNINEESINEV